MGFQQGELFVYSSGFSLALCPSEGGLLWSLGGWGEPSTPVPSGFWPRSFLVWVLVFFSSGSPLLTLAWIHFPAGFRAVTLKAVGGRGAWEARLGGSQLWSAQDFCKQSVTLTSDDQSPPSRPLPVPPTHTPSSLVCRWRVSGQPGLSELWIPSVHSSCHYPERLLRLPFGQFKLLQTLQLIFTEKLLFTVWEVIFAKATECKREEVESKPPFTPQPPNPLLGQILFLVCCWFAF